MTRTLMSPTRYPGFSNITFDAQQTFRALLHALSHPGSPTEIGVKLGHPDDLHPACAATCLTLLDIDTQVWVQPDFCSEVADWLVFHAGCRFVNSPGDADFALVKQGQSLPSLTQFNWGTPEIPEQSTTVLCKQTGLIPVHRLSSKGLEFRHSRTSSSVNCPIAFGRNGKTTLSAIRWASTCCGSAIAK